MAFPVVQTRNNNASATSNSTSFTPSLPSGYGAGDLLIVVVSADGNPTLSVNTGSSSAGWEKLGQASNGTVVTGAIFYNFCDSDSEALVVSSTASEQYSAISLRISGVTVGSIIGNSSNGSSTNSDPPALTLTEGTQDYLLLATRSGDSTVVATGAPTTLNGAAQTWTPLTTQAGGGTGGASTNTAETTKNTGTNPDPGAFTSATEQWVSWTIAVWAAPVSISPAQGSMAFTGHAPTATVDSPARTVEPGAASLSFTGLAPSAVIGSIIAVGAASASFTGHTPWTKMEAANDYGGGYGGLLLPFNQNLQPRIQVGAGSASFTGYVPSVGVSYVVDVENATLTLTGRAPTVTEAPVASDYTVTPDPASATLTGLTPDLYYSLVSFPGAGSLTFNGAAPSLAIESATDFGGGYGGLLLVLGNNLTGVTISVGAGSLTLTGHAPNLIFFGSVDPGPGALTLTGYAPTVATSAGARAYGPLTILGLNLDPLTSGYYSAPPAGSLTLTGYAPSAIRTGDSSLGEDWLVSGAATFSGTGSKAAGLASVIKSPASGSLAFTGHTPTVSNSVLITPFTGTLTLLGRLPTLALSIPIGNGSVTLAGAVPSVSQGFPPIHVPAGALTLSGHAPAANKTVVQVSGILRAGRGFLFKYLDQEGSGTLAALPASVISSVNRGVTGEGILTASFARMEGGGWELITVEESSWECQPTSDETWTSVTTDTEVWTQNG